MLAVDFMLVSTVQFSLLQLASAVDTGKAVSVVVLLAAVVLISRYCKD